MKMTDQELLDALSEIEANIFYRVATKAGRNENENEHLRMIHEHVNVALLEWHKIAGLTIS